MFLSILSFEMFTGLAMMVEHDTAINGVRTIDIYHAPPVYYVFVVGAIYSIYAFIYFFRKVELKVLSLYRKEDVGGVRYKNVQ
jgi:hypothetical protein